MFRQITKYTARGASLRLPATPCFMRIFGQDDKLVRKILQKGVDRERASGYLPLPATEQQLLTAAKKMFAKRKKVVDRERGKGA